MDHDLSLVALGSGTPTYVYSFERIAQNLDLLRDSFLGHIHIHYAIKTNSNRELLKRLKNNNVGIDAVSGGEIQRALECGFKGQDIIFSGVAKSVDEISLSLEINIKTFNVESPQELERIGELARKLHKRANISFRINPNVSPKTHPYITTGFKENKFGMDRRMLPQLLEILKKYKDSLALTGLDFHIGSQLLQIKPFEEALKKSVPVFKNLRSQGFKLKSFDIGGGIGVPYEGEKPFDLKKYGKIVEKYLRPLDCDILCEPGRFLLADAGVLLTQVEYVKKTPYKSFVIVNTGMHHLLRPALYKAYHSILPVVESKKGKTTKVDVVGPICESSDWIAKDRRLGLLAQNDILAVCDVGAYGYVMASDYNLHKKPREVFVD
jgi:diaminopimelate decarboxylase